MAASRSVEVTDKEINCVKENAHFSNDHLCYILKQYYSPCLHQMIA